jgi:hypothetical protein
VQQTEPFLAYCLTLKKESLCLSEASGYIPDEMVLEPRGLFVVMQHLCLGLDQNIDAYISKLLEEVKFRGTL